MPGTVFKASATALVFLSALPLMAAETSLVLDPARTEVKWTVGDVLHTVHGTFALKSGTFRFDPDTGSASGEIIVDVTSGQSGNKMRDGRMQREVLESRKYPEAVFTPDHYDGKTVHGSFKIHGEAHELNIEVQVDKHRDVYAATAHFVVPYVRWGMKNPSTFLLRVNDHVDIDIRTVGTPAQSDALR